MTQSVGQYELVRRIGGGGMAEVWMGRRASMGGATKTVAIKLMAARVARDERHRRMFMAEARLSMLMTHSNVVQVFDAGEENGRLYLVMEWIDGLDLAKLLALRRKDGQPWPPLLAGYVIGEVLRALAYAHHLTHEGESLCVVHRDISPHNVLVSTSGEVKLADFGVARLASEDTSGLHIKGKLRYMAPEHLAGRSREPTVDLFGVGAVLHELLAGARFRDEAVEVDLYGGILGGQVPALDVPGVPPELASLREGLLRAEPRERIPTAARALEYLGAWAGYRKASVELAALCTAAMAVVAPRSLPDSGPTERAVDPEADTMSPSATTRQSGLVAPGPSSGGTAATRTSAIAERIAAPKPSRDGAEIVAGRPLERRAFLVGGGVVGAGFVLGGIGVAVMRWREGEAPAREGVPAPLGSSGSSVARPAIADEAASTLAPAPTHAASASSETTRDETPSDAPSPSASPSPSAETDHEIEAAPSEASTSGAPQIEPTRAAARPEPRRRPATAATPAAPATIKLGLRSPVRVAYVRIGGISLVVDPKAEQRVAPGRHAIWWRESTEAPWLDGGTFAFEAGREYRLRVTSTGLVRE